MITILQTVSFGITPEDISIYKELADEYEAKVKAEGTFWGRYESTTSIAIASQRYIDVKKGGGTGEVPTAPIPTGSDTENSIE